MRESSSKGHRETNLILGIAFGIHGVVADVDAAVTTSCQDGKADDVDGAHGRSIEHSTAGPRPSVTERCAQAQRDKSESST